MEIAQDLAMAGGAPSVVVLGAFDGLHLGHQALVHQAKQVALQNKLRLLLVTFRPHPTQVLAPQLAPKLLCTNSDMRTLFQAAGVDLLVEQPFSTAFAQTDPRVFIERLQREANADHIVVGYDFRFGRARSGTPQVLQALCSEMKLELTVVAPRALDSGLVISSSKIRAFLLDGQVSHAALALGRPFHVSGQVVHGVARGRTLGFPTANVISETELVPQDGVYATFFEAPQVFEGVRQAVTNIGANPTFGDVNQSQIECHLLEQAPLNLYNAHVRVYFVERLRDECCFKSSSQLQSQIRDDIQQAKAVLQKNREPHWPMIA